MRKSFDFSGMPGVTWHQLFEEWGSAIQKMAQWPLIRWLTPAMPVNLIMGDGRLVSCIEKNGMGMVQPDAGTKSRFSGVVLPDDLVLWRTMSFPDLGSNELQEALVLDVMGASPFPPDDLIWVSTPLRRGDGKVKTSVCMTSRKIVEKHLATQRTVPDPSKAFEVWVNAPAQTDLMLIPGFGEKSRKKLSSRGLRVNLALLSLLTVTCVAAAITPTWQLRMRALQAVQDYEKLHSSAVPAVKNREQLLMLESQIEQIKVQIEKSIQPEASLSSLTQFMPDEAYLTGLQMQGNKITLIGLAPNAALLMQKLSAQAGVKDVRAPTAAVKARGTDRENFNIELTLETVQGGG
ncbi:MAG: proteinral secretion pathway protein L [Comamonadaceae bacterium]|nr:MAG: proteinral secretion pathway protein L [Comamonadaceae bacterium]